MRAASGGACFRTDPTETRLPAFPASAGRLTDIGLDMVGFRRARDGG